MVQHDNQGAALAIRLKDVEKWYGRMHVLRGITLDVAPGEKLVICGPSGSGKSTLIRCINQLEAHQRGSITVEGIAPVSYTHLTYACLGCRPVADACNTCVRPWSNSVTLVGAEAVTWRLPSAKACSSRCAAWPATPSGCRFCMPSPCGTASGT